MPSCNWSNNLKFGGTFDLQRLLNLKICFTWSLSPNFCWFQDKPGKTSKDNFLEIIFSKGPNDMTFAMDLFRTMFFLIMTFLVMFDEILVHQKSKILIPYVNLFSVANTFPEMAVINWNNFTVIVIQRKSNNRSYIFAVARITEK